MFSVHEKGPHSIRKRMISNIYSKSSLHNSPALASQATTILYDRLLPLLADSCGPEHSPRGVDVHSLWFAVTMDFITAYQFGLSHSSNFIQNVSYRQHWLSLYHTRKRYTFFSQELPRLKKHLQAIGIYLVPKWVDNANRELETWCASLCTAVTSSPASDSQSTNPGNEPVVVNAILAGISKEAESKGPTSILAPNLLAEPSLSLASEILDHLAAGHETSGIILTYLTWHLSHHPALQAALRAELHTLSPPITYPPSSKSTTTPTLPSSTQLDALPLLHALLLETLRLHASIPGAQPRVTPYPTSTLAGHAIPGGVRVASSAFHLHRNESVYPNPTQWDHTRWLVPGPSEGKETKRERQKGENGEAEEDDDDDESRARKERDRWFWPFSSGGRMCIGSHFAMHEMKLIVAAVYTNFSTYIEDDEGIEQEDGYTCGPRSNRLVLRFEKCI